MTVRCGVCKLDPQRRSAVDSALRGQVPLDQLSHLSGISKSSLHRHAQHLERSEALPATELTGQIEAADKQAVAVPQAAVPADPPSKSELRERVSLLWTEAMEGLSASKEPVRVMRPDGSTMEIPGDLRSRVGFLRVATSVAELGGQATGELTREAGTITNNTYVLVNHVPQVAPRPKVVDVKPEPDDCFKNGV
jgi:hypothetical protein